MSSVPVKRQPLYAHLVELRRRLLLSAVAFFVVSGAAYVYHSAIIQFLLAPLHQPVYYSSPSGGFEFLLRISSTVGLIVVVPVAVYHLIKFVEPALSFKINKNQLIIFLSASVGLLALGVAFGYIIMLPMTLHFFAEFGSKDIKALIAANDYLSLVIGLLATFAVLFQLPIIILLINRITPLTPGKLMKYQRHVIIGSLVAALILPFTYDPVTQFIMAAPIVGLYEVSIVLVWLINRRKPGPPQTPDPQVAPPLQTLPQPLAQPANFTVAGLRNSQPLGPRVLDLRPKP